VAVSKLQTKTRMAGPGCEDTERVRDALSTVGNTRKKGHLPACARAITQKSVIGSRQRKLSVAEAKRLQGLPDWFEMSGQTDAQSFRQLGNAYQSVRFG